MFCIKNISPESLNRHASPLPMFDDQIIYLLQILLRRARRPQRMLNIVRYQRVLALGWRFGPDGLGEAGLVGALELPFLNEGTDPAPVTNHIGILPNVYSAEAGFVHPGQLFFRISMAGALEA